MCFKWYQTNALRIEKNEPAHEKVACAYQTYLGLRTPNWHAQAHTKVFCHCAGYSFNVLVKEWESYPRFPSAFFSSALNFLRIELKIGLTLNQNESRTSFCKRVNYAYRETLYIAQSRLQNFIVSQIFRQMRKSQL